MYLIYKRITLYSSYLETVSSPLHMLQHYTDFGQYHSNTKAAYVQAQRITVVLSANKGSLNATANTYTLKDAQTNTKTTVDT